MAFIKSAVQRVLGTLGYEIVRRRPPNDSGTDDPPVAPKPTVPEDLSSEDCELVEFVQPYTLTSPERIYALAEAVRYVVRHKIPGDIVECGVWRGGSMMAVARVLLRAGVGRDLYLFDTFDGMTSPTENDVRYDGLEAAAILANHKKDMPTSYWCCSPIDEVRQNLSRSGYDPDKVHFIKGRVEDTIPAQAPESISILRLDTDWYESTHHELVHLFPRLAPGGVLIIDDYGWWKGARRATDEYLEKHKVKLLLNRIDLTGRIAVKP
jgi:hypothetical protein